MDRAINSVFDEISPVLSRDGQTLFFTRVGDPDFERTLMLDGQNLATLPEAQYQSELIDLFSQLADTPVLEPVSSPFNQDVWIADLSDASVMHPGYPLNSALPNSLVAITPDLQEFVAINRYSKDGTIERGFSLVRRTENDTWSNPEPMDIEGFYTLTSEVSLTMSFDGSLLILSAARKGSQDLDLFVCKKTDAGTWSAPLPLGEGINSLYRELTPFLSEDNQTLFFSSNRPSVFGGNDLYMSRRLDDTWQNWSQPLALSSPVNSASDESQPYFNSATGYLYFASKRDGSSDIFRVKIAPPVSTEIHLRGRVINAQTGKEIPDAVVFFQGAGLKKNQVSIENGTYSFPVLKGISYTVAPHKVGYVSASETVFFPKEARTFVDTFILDLMMQPLSVNSKIELPPVQFVQSKPLIREESYSDLNVLANLMRENPRLRIRVEGHTDNVGKPDDLIRLSVQRADALKTFLVDKGIEASRIETKGHGASKPINGNASESEKAANRRVEITVIQ